MLFDMAKRLNLSEVTEEQLKAAKEAYENARSNWHFSYEWEELSDDTVRLWVVFAQNKQAA